MTQLRYLDNTYLFTSTSHVLEIRKLEDERTAVILDQTIFYPQGGGQPCDTGTIRSKNSQFLVTDVRLDKDGTVYHMGTFEQSPFSPGDSVELNIDQERRIRHAKLHSAGHLIDCAVNQLGLQLKPTKGYHFSEGPYVEYEGDIENTSDIITALQEKIDTLLASDIPVIIHELSHEQAQQQGITAPEGKKSRIVEFQGFEPCGCGGTHVRSAKEIGNINIRKIKSKGGNTRISYAL